MENSKFNSPTTAYRTDTDSKPTSESAVESEIMLDADKEKTWHYKQVADKKGTIEHTISVTKELFTHKSEIKGKKLAIKERTDISLKNVRSVRACYGMSRNLGLVIFFAMLAVFAVFAVFYMVTREDSGTLSPTSLLLLLSGVVFAIIAIVNYRKITSVFLLEISTVGEVATDGFAYGPSLSPTSSNRGGGASFNVFPLIIGVVAAFLIPKVVSAMTLIELFGSTSIVSTICIALGLIFSMRSGRAKGGKSVNGTANGGYTLKMDEKTGNEIIETIGKYIMNADS